MSGSGGQLGLQDLIPAAAQWAAFLLATGLAVYWSWGWLTILPLGGAVMMTLRWFQFRAKWGMRF